MDNLHTIKELLSRIICKSYLPKSYFSIDDAILNKSTKIFEKDYLRWYDNTNIDINKLFLTPQLISVLCYRISRELFLKSQLFYNQQIGGNGEYAYSLLGRQIGLTEIFFSAEIGEGLKINRGGGTVIGARCKIGNNCTIHQGCTIGDRKGGRPVIGNNVMIYAGSLILGDINIGDNSVIGANSVVIHSCPPGSVLIGSPSLSI